MFVPSKICMFLCHTMNEGDLPMLSSKICMFLCQQKSGGPLELQDSSGGLLATSLSQCHANGFLLLKESRILVKEISFFIYSEVKYYL